MAATQVNLTEAKVRLSGLVERAAKGEEFVIARAGKPLARLTAFAEAETHVALDGPKIYREFGKNLLGITYIADDFDAPLPEEVLRDFGM
jgi:prevent-host-death family protein